MTKRSPYLLGGAGDNALLESVGLLLKVFPGLVIPEQIIFYLEMEHTYLSRTHLDSMEEKVISAPVSKHGLSAL